VKALLYYTPGWAPGELAAGLAEAGVLHRCVRSPGEVERTGVPSVVLVDKDEDTRTWLNARPALAESGIPLVVLGVQADLTPDAPAGSMLAALKAGFRESAALLVAARARQERDELVEIGIKLSTEKDYHTLLNEILVQARRVTGAEGGSLYLVEAERLHFALAQNDRRPDIPFVAYSMPLDEHSLAGYAALSGTPLVFEDVYHLPPGAPYTFNRSFDERYGYRTRSLVVVPMADHTGQVIGVLQLVNRRGPDEAGLPFGIGQVRLAQALAGQAGVALENSRLYLEIERLFEGFVRAAVDAIEQRDPATSGHSERVAALSLALAEAVDRVNTGPLGGVSFSPDQLRELRYASLLHDFGKVGVREHVLVKEKKLYPSDLALLRERHAYLVRSADWRLERARADYLERHGRAGYEGFLAGLRRSHEDDLARMAQFLRVVLEANEPTVLPRETRSRLEQYARETFEDVNGEVRNLLDPHELRLLSISQGNLDEEERLAIQRHVAHTYDFLRQIPWTRDLAGVPTIAFGHHEKLDGSGYPRGARGDEIPIQTRMMTISDIYDALTAADRSYKPAVAPDRALDILASEVRAGMLDPELFLVFTEARVYAPR
jgi:HD-GYP domain-containing protein (c-di-GMP phosphodiesterase class II)